MLQYILWIWHQHHNIICSLVLKSLVSIGFRIKYTTKRNEIINHRLYIYMVFIKNKLGHKYQSLFPKMLLCKSIPKILLQKYLCKIVLYKTKIVAIILQEKNVLCKHYFRCINCTFIFEKLCRVKNWFLESRNARI